MADNIYFEARNQGLGWSAVASVTLNRVNDKRFPNTVCSCQTLASNTSILETEW